MFWENVNKYIKKKIKQHNNIVIFPSKTNSTAISAVNVFVRSTRKLCFCCYMFSNFMVGGQGF